MSKLLVILSLALFAVVASGAGSPSSYKFTKKKDTLGIKVDRKTKGDTSTKADDWKEKFEWEIKATGAGIRVKNKYYYKANATNTKLEFFSYTKRIVEFVKNNPNSTDEKYTTQKVDKTWSLKFDDAVYQGCEDETAGVCTATFNSVDGCFTLVARANLGTFQGDGRISFGSDDMKLDYVFNDDDACEPAEGNALAVVSQLKSSTKTKKGKKSAEEKAKSAAGGENGIASDPDADGGVAYFKWLGVVDCGITKKRNVTTSLDSEGDDADIGEKDVIYTVHKLKGDGQCVWDPVQGIATAEDLGITSGASSTASRSVMAVALAAVALIMAF